MKKNHFLTFALTTSFLCADPKTIVGMSIRTKNHELEPAASSEAFATFGLIGQASYFYPFSNRVRDIYGNGWASYAFEMTQTYFKKWTVWEEIDWWQKGGNSTCLHNRTKIRLLSFKLGMEYPFELITHMQLYLGVGLDYSLLRVHDHSHFVQEHIRKGCFGFIVRTGIDYHFARYFFARFNLEYLHQRFHFSHHSHHPHVRRKNLDLSGIQIGAGLGARF